MTARPMRVDIVRHNTGAAARAAAIAREDAAREAIHPLPHSQLGAVGTIMAHRKHIAPALEAFPTAKPMAAWAASSRCARVGKKPA